VSDNWLIIHSTERLITGLSSIVMYISFCYPVFRADIGRLIVFFPSCPRVNRADELFVELLYKDGQIIFL